MLSRASVELMTTDQLSPAQKESGLIDGLGSTGGASACRWSPTHRHRRSVGAYGWDGGLGTAWTIDPAEDLVTVLLTQASWTSPACPPSPRTSAPRPGPPSTADG